MRCVFRFALLASLVLGSIALATTVRKFSLSELAAHSRAIVVARVISTESRWDDGEIYTYTTIEVTDGLKGARKGQSIVIRQLGGQVGDIASVIPGMPAFKANEEAVMFLSEKDKAGYPWIVGLEQGKYTIASDAGGKKMVRRNKGNLNLVGGGSDPSGALPEEAPLDVFLDQVRAELGIPVSAEPSEGAQ